MVGNNEMEESFQRDLTNARKKLEVGNSGTSQEVSSGGGSLTQPTLSSSLAEGLAIPFVNIAERNNLYTWQQAYQSAENNCFAALELLAQAASDPFLPTNMLPSRGACLESFVRQKRRSQGKNLHEHSRCANCNTSKTSLWRRNELGEVECNACNLYYRKNKRPRPLSLCKDTIAKRRRKSAAERNNVNK
ncbi:hypothetical protein RB195_020213 [Necator americanus]|uniref:GATA-type domain-containing protein n=1 Tax=Necator americanus TaxID=51031 RepID=A0ABR1CKK4_NECAM